MIKVIGHVTLIFSSALNNTTAIINYLEKESIGTAVQKADGCDDCNKHWTKNKKKKHYFLHGKKPRKAASKASLSPACK